MHGRNALAALAAASTLALGCGTSDSGEEPPPPLPAPSGGPAAGAAPMTAGAKARRRPETPLPARSADVRLLARGVAVDVGKRPKLRVEPAGRPPRRVRSIPVAELETGARARDGDLVVVRYTASTWAEAEEFDATWDRGDVFPFVLGSKGIMPGFNEGVRGMREGERKLVVIPPTDGYRVLGTPGEVGARQTLVFVVDLVDIERGTKVHEIEMPNKPGVAGDGVMDPKRVRR